MCAQWSSFCHPIVAECGAHRCCLSCTFMTERCWSWGYSRGVGHSRSGVESGAHCCSADVHRRMPESRKRERKTTPEESDDSQTRLQNPPKSHFPDGNIHPFHCWISRSYVPNSHISDSFG